MKRSNIEAMHASRGTRLALLALACACASTLCLAGCGESSTEPQGSGAASADSITASQDAAQQSGQESGQTLSAQSVGNGRGEASAAESDSTHGDSLDADKALEGQTNAHPITFSVSAPGYDSSDGKIPIAISGERVDGTAVDATAYIGPDGSGLSLSPGQYTVTVIESPLMDGGVFLRAPGKSWDVVVGDTLASGEGVSVEGTMTFTEMDSSEVTADEVETAYTYAVSGGLSKSTAKQYKAQILKSAGLS